MREAVQDMFSGFANNTVAKNVDLLITNCFEQHRTSGTKCVLQCKRNPVYVVHNRKSPPLREAERCMDCGGNKSALTGLK